MHNVASFHVTPLSSFRMSQALALVLNRENLDVLELEPIAASVLGRCQGTRPLEAHATAARLAGITANPHTIANAMDTLISLGLLRRTADADLAAASGPQTIDTVAIVTADRPHLLARALDAIARRRGSSSPCVLVLDGSRLHPTQTKAVVDRAGAETGLATKYVGEGEAARLRKQLADARIPQGVLDFALTPGEIGSNRNLATLMTAGQMVMMHDDDVVCEPWALPERDDGIVVGGHVDLRTWRFFTSRAEAMAAVTPVDVDLLAKHASVLGEPLANVLNAAPAAPDVEQACGHMVAALNESNSRAVRVTISGLAGDAARYCSHAVLFLEGDPRQALWSDPGTFETAITSREVFHIARRTILTHDPACMAYCTGVDNTSLVPPFMPIGRNEDGVWAAMLGFIDPQAIFAHLPYGVRHQSDRLATYDEPMLSVRQSRISEFLLFVTRNIARSTFAMTPADRLRHLGQVLIQIGELASADFRLLVTEARLATLCAELSRQESVAAADPDCPVYWQAAFEEYRRVFRKSLTRPDFFLPVEFGNASVEGGFSKAQAFVGQFGELLAWWPQVWETASQNR